METPLPARSLRGSAWVPCSPLTPTNPSALNLPAPGTPALSAPVGGSEGSSRVALPTKRARSPEYGIKKNDFCKACKNLPKALTNLPGVRQAEEPPRRQTGRPSSAPGGGSGCSPAVPQPRRAAPGAGGGHPAAGGAAAAPRGEKSSPPDERRAVPSRGGASLARPAAARQGDSRRGAESPALDVPPSALPARGDLRGPGCSRAGAEPPVAGAGPSRESPWKASPPKPLTPQKTPGATSPFTGLVRPVTGAFPSESKAEIKEHPPESECTVLIWIIVECSPGVRFSF